MFPGYIKVRIKYKTKTNFNRNHFEIIANIILRFCSSSVLLRTKIYARLRSNSFSNTA